MRRAIPTIGLAVAATLLVAVAASGELAQDGNLRVTFNGNFSPTALPRERPVPITVEVEGAVATTDGSAPPVLKRIEVAINRNGLLSTRGLPVCRASQLQSRSTETALERCRAALVGHGSFTARIEAVEPVPAKGKILAFNGRVGGKPALLLQLSSKAPVQIAFVVPLQIKDRPGGQFGTVLESRLPVLAAGAATVTAIRLEIGRTYSYRGQRRGFVSASCAAPAGLPRTVFAFARGSFEFSNGKTVDTSLVRDCRVR